MKPLGLPFLILLAIHGNIFSFHCKSLLHEEELGLLSSLQEIILNNNLFFGTIPKQIGMLKNLTVLDLSVNRLSGPIPTELGNLSSITKINFHYNDLTGCIPPDFGKLLNLVELRLDRNRLSGPIPGNNSSDSNPQAHNLSMPLNNVNDLHFCHFPRLKIGDFSYNFLVGEIPSCLKYLPRSSFQGNCLQDEYSVLQRTPQICTISYPSFYTSYGSIYYHKSLKLFLIYSSKPMNLKDSENSEQLLM